MGARLRLWWRQIKRPLSVIGIIAVNMLVIVLIVGIIGGYIFHWGWAGLSRKTLWDWLQLLIIPIVLAIGGFWLNQIQKDREQKASDQRANRELRASDQQANVEREIATDNQREVALQSYIDKMSELLLDKGLRKPQPEEEVRSIARVRTLTVLTQLDFFRKKTVLQFLHESGLIDKVQPIIALSEANLSKAYLSGANLSGANLTHVRLSGANLNGANLHEAELHGANLGEAELHEADLSESDLSGANLHGTDLSGANLSGANLNGANLREAFLSAANLNEAVQSGTDISEFFLDRAFEGDRSGANLIIVRDADLSGADLSGAVLSGAFVTTEQLAQAKSLQGATMPNGSIHP